MFGRRIDLFRLFGFPVRVDASWLVIAVVVAWSLAAGFFPSRYPGFSGAMYWGMGILGAVGLFGAIIVHEACHALVARRNGIPMRGITLFIFGGVAEMEGEPQGPNAELAMAAAGPLASIVIALAGFGVAALGRGHWPVPVTAVITYVAMINAVLVAFNLLPAFPLDGGRIFRAALWKWKGDLQWATRVASHVGTGFSVLFMALGVASFIFGNFISGLWWFFIGLFLRQASTASYEQVLLRRAFHGEPVGRFMTAQPVTVPPAITLEQLVDGYVYHYHHKLFPVVDDGRLLGSVSTRQLKAVPRDEWARRTVQSALEPCSPENTVTPETDALQVLATMRRTGRQRLMVVSEGRLAGIVTLKDLLQFFGLKMELEP